MTWPDGPPPSARTPRSGLVTCRIQGRPNSVRLSSRRAITKGPVIIECPPTSPDGPVYKFYETYKAKTAAGEELSAESFRIFEYDYTCGIRDGFLDDEFIEAERERLGVLFGMFYGVKWHASGLTWYEEDALRTGNMATQMFAILHAGRGDGVSTTAKH